MREVEVGFVLAEELLSHFYKSLYPSIRVTLDKFARVCLCVRALQARMFIHFENIEPMLYVLSRGHTI